MMMMMMMVMMIEQDDDDEINNSTLLLLAAFGLAFASLSSLASGRFFLDGIPILCIRCLLGVLFLLGNVLAGSFKTTLVPSIWNVRDVLDLGRIRGLPDGYAGGRAQSASHDIWHFFLVVVINCRDISVIRHL